MLEKVVRIGILYNLYGPLLTEHQKSLVELYYYQDLSLGEIAKEYGISRQAVYDNIRRAEETLETCERELKFEERLIELRNTLLSLERELESILSSVDERKRGHIHTLIKELMELVE